MYYLIVNFMRLAQFLMLNNLIDTTVCLGHFHLIHSLDSHDYFSHMTFIKPEHMSLSI